MALESFVRKTLDLLDKEREAEIEETRCLTEKLPARELQRRGVCLLKLRMSSRKSGLYGRTVATFEPKLQGELPSHSLTPGDIVALSLTTAETASESLASGIISKVGPSYISVAFEEGCDVFAFDDDDLYKLMKLANDVTYQRLKRILGDLNKYGSGPASKLINVLFGNSELSPPLQDQEIGFINGSLDGSQQEAVHFALCQREMAVIHGPPGTGKTTTVVELIAQAVRRQMKVLACAPSNIAVDNLVERLAAITGGGGGAGGGGRLRLVRVGHPARLLPHLQRHSLDAIVSSSPETRLVQDVRHDLDKASSKLKGASAAERRGLRDEMRSLRRELKQREQAATREILRRADVVLVTLTSATDSGPLKLLDKEHFNLVVIDECSQAMEAACWIGLLRAPRCVLAGDHKQLPPTILSKEAAKEGLEKTLMERVLESHGDQVMRMLTTQYRMHQSIMQWSSQQLYGGRLVAHESVSSHLLSDLEGVEVTEETQIPLLLIDTAGCDLSELDLPEEISKGNEGEANVVAAHVKKLLAAGMKAEDIAVIAPYNLQVELLRIRLTPEHPKLEIKSVDGFQGREKEAVVISFVRSNSKGEVGFLSENRRINVAITRARRHLAVVCDSETVSHDAFLRSLVEYMANSGQVWTAQDYLQDDVVEHQRPEHLDSLLQAGSEVKAGRGKPGGEGRKKKKKGKEKPKAEPLSSASQKNGATAQPGPPELDDIEVKTEKYQVVLESFMKDEAQVRMDFPPSLTSHDRLVVHQVSERLGLLHVSEGDGKDRHIVVSKPGHSKPPTSSLDKSAAPQTVEDTTSGVAPSENGDGETDSAVAPEPSDEKLAPADSRQPETLKAHDPGKVPCRHCSKDVITANITLHELHCGRPSSARPKAPASSESSASAAIKAELKQRSKSARKGGDKGVKIAAAALNKVDSEDFDAMIQAVQTLDSRCSFKKCKTFTVTLGQTCPHCSLRYCLAHHVPEIHGCGEAAHAAARRSILREGVLYQGSGVPSKKPDARTHASQQRKLDKKLEELKEKRSAKKSGKK